MDEYEPMMEDTLSGPSPIHQHQRNMSANLRDSHGLTMYTIDQRKSLLTGSNPFKGYSTVREKGYEMPSTKQFKE